MLTALTKNGSRIDFRVKPLLSNRAQNLSFHCDSSGNDAPKGFGYSWFCDVTRQQNGTTTIMEQGTVDVFIAMPHAQSMALLSLDTYEFVHGLTKAGISEQQAKAIAEGLKQVNLENVATKQDIDQVRREVRQVKIDLLKWIVPLLLGQTAVFGILVQWLVR